jgi:hypothetical protein
MAGQAQGDNESVQAFVNRRQREAAALAFARANAHQAYGLNIRGGQDLDLQQPSDLAAYGLQPLSSSKPSSAVARSPVAADRSSAARDPLLPVDAAIRSAANTVTFGGADKIAAAMDALTGGGLSGWGKRYDANLQQEQARDRYDAAHAPLAWSAASAGGGVLGLFTLGPEEAAAAAAPRLAGAARLTAKEAAGIVGAGGLAGLGSQTVSDIATGHRSTLGDKSGAMLGGMAGGAALPFFGPSRAGAVNGAVTSATQDFLNGRPISIPQTVQSALTGGLLAGATGSVGRKWSDSLSTTEKGQLGETLGAMRSAVNGEPRWQGPKVRAPLSPKQTTPLQGKKTYWIPDGLDGPPPADPSEPWPDMFEDKFGYGADTSPNQKIAQAKFGSRFRLNHFTPSDVGMVTAFPFLTAAPQFVHQDQGQ